MSRQKIDKVKLFFTSFREVQNKTLGMRNAGRP